MWLLVLTLQGCDSLWAAQPPHPELLILSQRTVWIPSRSENDLRKKKGEKVAGLGSKRGRGAASTEEWELRLGQPPGAPGLRGGPAPACSEAASGPAGPWPALAFCSFQTLFQVFSPSAMSVTAAGPQSQLNYLPTFYLITQ